MVQRYEEQWAFYEQLRYYYLDHKNAIRSRYKRMTLKLLDYNDRSVRSEAFLRPPQFEAFEMYVFVKEFLNNEPMYKIFDDWRKRRRVFEDDTRYSRGQATLFDMGAEKQTEKLFRQMRDVSESYPNYIFALTMGLGKTILMGTCIFYEFLLANKFPKDERFCHNALVFAPDKTVLQSLKEIPTFDKSLVVPPEYVSVIDQNLRVHFLEDTGVTLHTLDDSDFNLIIANDQKILVKKRRKEVTPTERFFTMPSGLLSTVYGDDADDAQNDADLMSNQRFAKLCRLKQVGVYVDEAHHLFGSDLKKSLSDKMSENSLRRTINMLDDALVEKGSRVVACFNYTGTPYVQNKVLPDVLYVYGLSEAINKGYLKRARVLGYEHVRSEEFLRQAITDFWKTYGETKHEGLLPKLAIFASRIEEVQSEILPAVERILADLGIDSDKILVNTGDPKQTKAEDIHIFNNLDNPNAGGNDKQFIILVGKGREGWNCRSLFGVALDREPKSKIFVLQATMRCLRQIDTTQQRATVYLSQANFDTLDTELNENFNMSIDGLKGAKPDKKVWRVRMVLPERKVKLSRIQRSYSLERRDDEGSIDFGLDTINLGPYEAHVHEKADIARDVSIKEIDAELDQGQMKYSQMTLVGELARLLGPEVSCLSIERLLKESTESTEKVLSYVNKHNEIITDVLVPRIFDHLFRVNVKKKSVPIEVSLLKPPKDSEWYEFSASPSLVAKQGDAKYDNLDVKSFHADTYCFDSKPEKELFNQLVNSNEDIAEVYFTGMFTNGQSGLTIQYVDPESHIIRNYYPDFFVRKSDDKVELIEVKGDNKIDDAIVQAKAAAAKEIADASEIEYGIIAGNYIMKHDVSGMTLEEAQQRSIAEARSEYSDGGLQAQINGDEQ
ncbi:MAG: DEAD/DEAH box helicase family protein [Atopobiaceae bacterium]|uniref:Type III restriction endonuclease n=2 Tax=Bacteria TaxID=2 RepID=A0A4S2F5J9_9ACTN|nr:TnsA endonuclease N-terminal domain-containing protein [Muricaecibacterium torontonense]MCI8676558.1 DEAD/DEAH box helicase family protein [Atopobiaceae bacterium]TGY62541.1 type III restriction endonuclease [Muricaecibacterium torontonense]